MNQLKWNPTRYDFDIIEHTTEWYDTASVFRSRITDDGEFSNPSYAVDSEVFGLGARAGVGSSAFGNGALALSSNASAFGSGAVSSNISTCALGSLSLASGLFSLAMGQGSQATGTFSIALGQIALASNINCFAMGPASQATQPNAIAIGLFAQCNYTNSMSIGANSVATKDNQIVFGSAATEIYLGSGVTSGTPPASISHRTTGGQGTDIQASNYAIHGGASTGIATPGKITFLIGVKGASSAIPQSYEERFIIDEDKVQIIASATATNAFEVLANDGTTLQAAITDTGNLTLSGAGGDDSITINGVFTSAKFFVHAETIGGHAALYENHSDVSSEGVKSFFARSRGDQTTELVVVNGDILHESVFLGHDGTDYERAASICVEADGNVTNDVMPGRLVFLTTPAGGNTPLETIRFNSDGSFETAREMTTPSTPAFANHHKLYFKSDDNLYSLNDAGVEKIISAQDHIDITKLNAHGNVSDAALTMYDGPGAIHSLDYPLTTNSGITFGSGNAVGHIHDTDNPITVTGDKHTSWRRGGVEFASFSPTSFGTFVMGEHTLVTAGFCAGYQNTQTGSYGATFGFGNVATSGGTFTAGLSNTNNSIYGVVAGFSNSAAGSAFFAVCLGNSNTVGGLAGGGSVTLGGNNTNDGSGAVVIGANNSNYASNAVVLGSYMKNRAGTTFMIGADLHAPVTVTGTRKVMLGAGESTNNMVASRRGSLNIALDKAYASMFMEKNKRGYLETPVMAIAESDAVDGNELAVTATFSKTADGTTPLDQVLTGLEVGATYRLQFTVDATTVADEGFTPSLTTMGITFNTRDFQTGLKTEIFTATSTTDTLSFTPSNLSRFEVSGISVQKIVGGNLSVSGNTFMNGGMVLPTRETTVATTIVNGDHTIRFINTADVTQTLPTTLPVGSILAIKNKSNYAIYLIGTVDDQVDPVIPANAFPQPTMRIQFNELGTWDII